MVESGFRGLASPLPLAGSSHRIVRCDAGGGSLSTRAVCPAAPPPPQPPPASGRGSRSSSLGPESKRPPSPEAFSFLNCVLGGLDRPCANDLPGRLGLEHHFFAREGVGTLPSLGRGLLDHDELREAGDEEHPVLLQLLVTDVNQRFHHALDLFLRNFGGGRDLFDQLRLRHLGSHVCSIDSGKGTLWRKPPKKTGFSTFCTAISPRKALFPAFQGV